MLNEIIKKIISLFNKNAVQPVAIIATQIEAKDQQIVAEVKEVVAKVEMVVEEVASVPQKAKRSRRKKK